MSKSKMDYYLEAREQWEQQLSLLTTTLTDDLDFMVFRKSESYLSLIGTSANDMSQKVIIDRAGRTISVQELEHSNSVTQCVFTFHLGYAGNLANQVLSVVKANRG